jgi:two-component system, chemotaxis family, protein-glutamate methylesterase/glutaminase
MSADTPAARQKIRTLVVDDSTVMRTLLRMALEPRPEVEIVGVARDGVTALEALDFLRPDLMLLDIEMPGIDGLEVLARAREHHPAVRVIMCSTLTRRGAAITLEALARGAADYVTKPEAQRGVREGVETLTRELLPKILALFPSEITTTSFGAAFSTSLQPLPHAPKALVIGVSTGGPAALEKLLPALPADFPLPILIAQHMPQLFTALLAERLNSLCALEVREAVPGVRPDPGSVWIARGDWHMEITPDFHLRLRQAAPRELCRPSVDLLFHSAVAAWRGNLLAVLLTGMGSDGLAGCRAVRDAGGLVFVQDRATSAVWGMPGVVAEAGLAHMVLPLDAMAREIRYVAARQLISAHRGRGA